MFNILEEGNTLELSLAEIDRRCVSRMAGGYDLTMCLLWKQVFVRFLIVNRYRQLLHSCAVTELMDEIMMRI